jgi:hypothetical protein
LLKELVHEKGTGAHTASVLVDLCENPDGTPEYLRHLKSGKSDKEFDWSPPDFLETE